MKALSIKHITRISAPVLFSSDRPSAGSAYRVSFTITFEAVCGNQRGRENIHQIVATVHIGAEFRQNTLETFWIVGKTLWPQDVKFLLDVDGLLYRELNEQLCQAAPVYALTIIAPK